MRQSKSLGQLVGPASSGALKRKSGVQKDAPELVFPASADAYELLDDCGRGCSAVVWRARCLTNNEIVAVKILDLECQMAPLEDIVHEAQTMKAYKHAAILGLYVCFVHEIHLWMVMPYMEGGSVAHIMRYRYPDGLQEAAIATIMKEVLSALAYIHSHGDIHRDVKAGNVLVAGDGHVQLGDFGVAASMERQDWGAPQGRNTFAGTVCWMAPEVLEQDTYGPKADIWSAGITMLELAHGHAPFSKLSPIKVLLLTLQGPPPTLEAESKGRHFSRSMREVVASCLNKDPTKRPTAKQLLSKGFFKQAKDADYLKRTILAGLPPLPQRCMEIRMGKGRAATLALENDRAAMASHISYITDVAQWDFKCTKSTDEGEPGQPGWVTSGDTSPPPGSTAEAAVGAAAPGSLPLGSRGDQHAPQQQPTQQQQLGQHTAGPGAAANGVAAGLGSSTSLDVPGDQQQQGVVGLEGFLSTQQQQQQQVVVAGDAGPGARDVGTSDSSADGRRTAADAAGTAEKVASPVRQLAAGRPGQQLASPRSPTPAAAAEAHTAGTPKVLTCYAGGKTITTFPVSVPDTPEHSPMHSRPSTPEAQLKLGRGVTVSDPGSAAAAAAGGSAPQAAKKHGRFTYVEGSARYVGPDLVSGEPTASAAAAGGSGSAAAAGAAGAPAGAGAAGGVVPGRGYELLKQRSVSSPDMALLFSMQGVPGSGTSGALGGAAAGSALSDAAPLSPVSPVSDTSAASSSAGLSGSSAAAAAANRPAEVAASSGLGASALAGALGSPGRQQQQQPHQQQPLTPQQAVSRSGTGELSPRQQQLPADAGLGSPRRPSSPAAGGSGLFAKLLPHKPTADVHSPRRSQSPLPQHGGHAEPHHHLLEPHHLQHKIAGFFSHHGLGKGGSPFSSRDASPQVRQQQQHGGHEGGSGHGSSRAGAAAAGGGGGGVYGGSSSSSAGPSLSRHANSLQDIYPEGYGSKDAGRSPAEQSSRSHSPRAGPGRAAGGGKEPGHFWQHVKEACAETASDVAHIFKSRSGGSLHQQADRSSSRSPERPSHQQQQQQQPTSPPSPKPPASPRQLQPDGDSRQQQDDQAAAVPAAASDAGRPSSSVGAAAAPTAAAAAGSSAVAAAAAAAPPAGRTGSSSNLVRLGSRVSIPAVSLSDLSCAGSTSSSSKPPRYQQPPARVASGEQLSKQPPPEQQQQQVLEPQVHLKQQLLAQQQQEVQQELLVMQQQQGMPKDDVQAAAASVRSLAAAAEAVGQATAAAGVSVSRPASPPPVGSRVAVNGAAQQATQSCSSSSSVTPAPYPTLAELHSLEEEGAAAPGAAVAGLSELGSRELSFAPGSGDISSTADGSSPARSAAGGVASYALHSPDKPQQQELGVESSVTFPTVAARTSSGSGASQPAQPQPARLDEEQQRGRPLHAAASSAAPAAMAASDPQKVQQQQRAVPEPRSAHPSASPSRRHKGRFTITET